MNSLGQHRSFVPALMPGSPRRGPGPVRFSLDAVPERERIAVYREFFGRSVCRFEIGPLDDVPFFADVVLNSLPGLQLFAGRVQGTRCGRTRNLLADGTDDVSLIVNLGGPYLATQLGRELVLGDGDATIVSEADPFYLAHRPPGGLLVLRAPRARLAPLLGRPEDRALRRIQGSDEALRLLTGYVETARRQPTITSPGLQHAIVTHIHDLIALAVGATRDATELAEGRGLRAARLHAIKKDIGDSLDRADLSVADLAVRHHLTPRFIQRLFEAEGTTFTEYLLTQRLARAHRMLTDPRRASEKISTIAFDAGFNDVSYFNRVFRRLYGDTPSALRGQVSQQPWQRD